jgi:hypothetical protein
MLSERYGSLWKDTILTCRFACLPDKCLTFDKPILDLSEGDLRELPIALPGVTVQDFDQEKQRLESLLQSGIAPPLPGVELSERIALSSGSSAFVIRIPRSWNSPHMVSFRGRSAFYGRTSAGKYQLD